MKKILSLLLGLLMLLGCCSCAEGETAENMIKNPLQQDRVKLLRFDYADIALGEGTFQDTFAEAVDYYMSLDVDDILYEMRVSAGIDTKGGQTLIDGPNWYYNGNCMIGFWIWAYSRMYAITQNEEIQKQANELTDGLKEVWDKSPSYVIPGDAFFYPVEKFIQGLIADYQYCGNENAKELCLDTLDYSVARLNEERAFGNNGDEWYILSESIYKAIEAFYLQDQTYRDFAKKYEYTQFWDIFANGENVLDYKPEKGNYPTHFHAFSHINSLCGAAMAYKDSGDEYYFTVLERAYEWLRTTQMLATGAVGPSYEHLLSRDEIIDAVNSDKNDSAEVQCTSYALTKLCDYMLTFTADAEYGDWMEKMLWNVTVATPPIEDGHVMYYADYTTDGGKKVNRTEQWTCCVGSRPVLITDTVQSIYYNDTQNIYVNQFINSSVRLNKYDNTIQLTQESDFPRSNTVNLRVNLAQSDTFQLILRKPAWAAAFQVKVNGETYNASQQDHWIVIDRTWQDGDSVELCLEMNLYISEIDSEQYEGEGIYALMYGPVALAAELNIAGKTPDKLVDYTTILDDLVRADENQAMIFRMEKQPAVVFKAYYQIPQEELYYLYIKK